MDEAEGWRSYPGTLEKKIKEDLGSVEKMKESLTATEATALRQPVKVGMPVIVMELMKLYPQPVQQSGVEFLPIDVPRQRRVS